MSQDIFTKILDDHRELSSLPQTLAEVLRVVRDDDSCAQDLADVIIKDPALTAKVLRIVNSPFYGVGREITTMTQAVMTLGLRAISALALSTSVYDMTGKWKTDIDRKRFWRHSLEVAIASRMVAEQVGYPRAEEAWIAGLLHDIGLLILEKSFPEKFSRIWAEYEKGENTLPLEEAAWGTNHARVGQFLMEQWHLPGIISQAIGMHHAPYNDEPPDPKNPMEQAMQLCRIVALANAMATFTIGGVSGAVAPEPQRRISLMHGLGIESDKLESVQQKLMAETSQEARFLEIDVGSEEELLTEANRALYVQYRAIEELLLEQKRMKDQIEKAKLKAASLEALNTISATFNHYVNNAAATILGRAQLIQVGIENGDIRAQREKISSATEIIVRSVQTITLVMDELKKLTTFDTVVYHDDTFILDIQDKIKTQLEQIRTDLAATV